MCRVRLESEINLLGKRVEQALRDVEEFIDSAALAGLGEVRLRYVPMDLVQPPWIGRKSATGHTSPVTETKK